MVSLVDVCLHLTQIQEAAALSKIVLEMAPRLGPPLLLPIFDNHDQFVQAGQMAKRILADAPEIPEAHLCLARKSAATGDFKTAASHLERAFAAIDPARQKEQYAQALFVQGFSAAQKNQAAEALQGFRDSIAIRPNHSKTQMYLFLTLFSLNRRDEALDALHAWIESYPQPNNLIFSAKMCDVVGLHDEAARFRGRLQSEKKSGTTDEH